MQMSSSHNAPHSTTLCRYVVRGDDPLPCRRMSFTEWYALYSVGPEELSTEELDTKE